MAIVTDQTVTIHGVSVGISKPIQTLIANGDFTYDELSKFAIVGRHDFVNDVAGIFEPDNYSYTPGTASVIQALDKYPVINDPTAPNWDTIDYIYTGQCDRLYDNYGKMVLVYNMTSSAKDINKNFNDSNTACIVTEFNPRLIKMMGTVNAYSETATVGEPGSYMRYDVEASRTFVWMDDDTSAPFASLLIQNFDDAVYFDFPLYDNVFTANQTIAGVRDSMYVQMSFDFDDYQQTGNKLLSVWASGGIDDFMQGADYNNSFFGVNNLSNDRGNKIICLSYTAYPDYGGIAFVRPSDMDTALKQLAGCGFYFEVNGTVYKPITESGVVTGYTADLSKNGQWDLINNVTGNSIPDTPGGGDSGDSVDDMTVDPLFGLASDAGFAAYYLLTASNLASLHTWLTTTTFPDGYDPYPYIISLVQFPLKLSPTWCLAGTSGSIHIGGEDTGVTASLIGKEQTWRGLGSFNVPRLHNNFLDYDPYTQYEVYIPCCGWVTVPDIVAGHQINVRINYDLTDAAIIGNVYVKINGDALLIASKSGMMGRQTVVSGEAQGVKSAQITSALLSAGTGALNVATGIISGNAVAAVSGGYNIVAGLAQANIAGNSSYVRSIGSTGGRALLCQYDKCYMKITTTKTDIPSNYGHTIGYICNKPGKVSDFSGFSIFDNVDTSGIGGTTEREREMIKRILESGVIINAAPSPEP